LIGLCLIAAIIGIVIRFLTPTQGNGIFILALVYGAATFPVYSICTAHMNDHVAEGGFVEASSGMLLLFAAGAVIGPLIASPIMSQLNAYGLFSFTAVLQALLAIYAVTRLRARAAIPEDERTRFVDSLRATHTVSAIDTSVEEPAQEPGENGEASDTTENKDTPE
jgi:MFS family permease